MSNLKKASYVACAALGVCLIKQFANGPSCKSTTRIDGKVVIVTGANSGIGKETVRELAKRGGKVYLACRSVERAQNAVDEIILSTGVDRKQLPVMHLNLASMESIRNFVKEFKTREKKLDILVNNAGLMTSDRQQTADGFEATFGVNHLGPFLLTHLLMDILVAAGSRSRIVNVSSEAHVRGSIDLEDLMAEHSYESYKAYAQSKLANIHFSRELSRRIGSVVSVYSLHPGVVRTDLFQNLPILKNLPAVRVITTSVFWLFTKEPWYGAQTSVYCAVDEDIALETGKYYRDCVEKEPALHARDDSVAAELWDLSVGLVRLEPPEIHPLLR